MKTLSTFQFLETHVKKLQIIAGVGLLFFCSQLTIPLQPIPITLQSVAVLLIGLTYAPREAFYTTLSWLTLGLIGLPVFADFSGGWHCFVSPSAGYLVGFLVAAVALSQLSEQDKSKTFLTTLLLSFYGTALIFGFGVSWLAISIGNVKQAVMVGLVPFVLPGMAKAAFLAATLRLARTFAIK